MLTLAKSRGPRELPVAMIPLLFGIQQLTEGLLWPSLHNNLPRLQTWATYISAQVCAPLTASARRLDWAHRGPEGFATKASGRGG